jgi:hypothetical protein
VQTCCPIVELRQYTLHPGKRDALIDLFEREFIEPQEALGMKIIGQFRDLDNPDRFVWLRGFQDMTTRAQALQAFYGGPVWKMHREAANETMIDSDNVLLLHPARSNSGFAFQNGAHPPRGANAIPNGIVVATIYYLDSPADVSLVNFFDRTLKSMLSAHGAPVPAYFVTYKSENTFPALPVREGENVFVWFARFENQIAHAKFAAALNESPKWRDEVSKALECHTRKSPEVLRLSPTARSHIR